MGEPWKATGEPPPPPHNPTTPYRPARSRKLRKLRKNWPKKDSGPCRQSGLPPANPSKTRKPLSRKTCASIRFHVSYTRRCFARRCRTGHICVEGRPKACKPSQEHHASLPSGRNTMQTSTGKAATFQKPVDSSSSCRVLSLPSEEEKEKTGGPVAWLLGWQAQTQCWQAKPPLPRLCMLYLANQHPIAGHVHVHW